MFTDETGDPEGKPRSHPRPELQLAPELAARRPLPVGPGGQGVSPSGRGAPNPLARETQLALALLDGTARLHQDDDRTLLASHAVTAVERACPDAAAALFEWLEDAAVLVLLAAGPRWRTAEREAPAWLAGECGALACLLRSTKPAAGQLPATSACAAAHIVAVPLTASVPAVLIVAWPSTAQPASGVAPLLERFARHLSSALDRGAAEQMGRADRELHEGLQDALRQQQLGMLGELARGLVHDLSNSMTTIVGTADWLLHAVPDQSVKGELERLRSAALDAAALVKRVRLLRSSGDVGREIADLAAIGGSAIDTVRARLADARVAGRAVHDLRLEAPASIRARVSPTEIRELLVNLLTNAIEAMPDGGTVTLAVGGDEREAWAEVQDEGQGVAPAVLDRLFDPFVTTRERNGAGLGLSVCWSIARAHGGRITLRPGANGRGTTARLSLPAARTGSVQVLPARRARSAPPAPLTPARPRPLRVLLVDDQDDVRSVIADMLTVLGHVVTEAPDAESALGALAPDVDLVITDWAMPGSSGAELARAITTRRPGLPVLLLTGWGSLPGPTAESHVTAVLAKPVTLATLRETIDASVRHPHAGGEAA